MNYNYTEEHYAEMYNNLPEGLKDLVLSGRLAIQVSAIGSRHGLNADQVADLEPAVEDVCLGLIFKTQLAENIKNQVGVDDRVANRIAAEVEIEILRPFEPELIIARQQKEDLDKKISSPKASMQQAARPVTTAQPAPERQIKEEFVPKDVSEKSNVSAIKNFYNSSSNQASTNTDNQATTATINSGSNFDWDNFGKKTTPPQPTKTTDKQETKADLTVDEKIDKLTDTINKLVMDRFGGEKKDDGLSEQMKQLMQRLEMAEKENQENKKLIQKLQDKNQLSTIAKTSTDFFDLPKDANKINVDKPRNVAIDKSKTPIGVNNDIAGNVKISATNQNPIPVQQSTEPKKDIALKDDSLKDPKIYSSVVSQATADTIVETRNKENTLTPITSSSKKVLSLDELLKKNDTKINEAKPTSAQIVFPTIGTEKRIDIKNVAQTDGLRQTLLDDIQFLKKKMDKAPAKDVEKNTDTMTNTQQSIASKHDDTTSTAQTTSTDTSSGTQTQNDVQNLAGMQTSSSVTLSQFKDELIPKTKEDRMKALQDKIKAMNKGVSVGGATNIAASALDPYKL